MTVPGCPRTEGRHPLPWFVPTLLVWVAAGALAGPLPDHPPAPVAPAAAGEAGSSDESAPSRIDINEASVEELCKLPGVGKKRAESIVAYRNRRRFTRPTQLLNIRGIGRKTLERMRPMVYVAPKQKRRSRRKAMVRSEDCPPAPVAAGAAANEK